jgi:hypothetical protein
MEPTKEELLIAEWIAAYGNKDDLMDWTGYRKIVDFLAERMCHDGAAWKNRVMFHLTGCDGLCNYKD